MSDSNVESIFHRWENDRGVVYAATVCHQNLPLIRHLPGVLKVGRYGAVIYRLGSKVVLDHGDLIIREGEDRYVPCRLGKFQTDHYLHYEDKCPACQSAEVVSASR